MSGVRGDSRFEFASWALMRSTVVAVLVVTLLAPGLLVLIAIVLRSLFRGTPRPPDENTIDGDVDSLADPSRAEDHG